MSEEQFFLKFVKWNYLAVQIFTSIFIISSIIFYLIILITYNFSYDSIIVYVSLLPIIFIGNKLIYKREIKKIGKKAYSIKDGIKIARIMLIFVSIIISFMIVYLSIFKIFKGYNFEDRYYDVYYYILIGHYLHLTDFLSYCYIIIILVMTLSFVLIFLFRIQKLNIIQ